LSRGEPSKETRARRPKQGDPSKETRARRPEQGDPSKETQARRPEQGDPSKETRARRPEQGDPSKETQPKIGELVYYKRSVFAHESLTSMLMLSLLKILKGALSASFSFVFTVALSRCLSLQTFLSPIFCHLLPMFGWRTFRSLKSGMKNRMNYVQVSENLLLSFAALC
jgi:hypothetical protein